MRGFLRPSRPNGRPPARSPGADADYRKIDPYIGNPISSQPSPHATQQPPRSNPVLPLQQQSQANTPIYDQHAHPAPARNELLSRRHSLRTSTDDEWIAINNPSARPEATPVSALPSQVPPPVVESRMSSAPSLPPGAAQPVIHGAGLPGSHSNPQSPAGVQSPSQLWSSKPSPAVLSKKSQPPTMNGVALPPRVNGHASGNSLQYVNGRSGTDSHDNGGEGSIHSEEIKPWRGIFGSSKEREREKEAQKELTRMIGFLTATASDDWTLVLELCERASASESAAREAAKALRQEFKYADPPAQLSAARLWAIMLQNSNNLFSVQTATRKFMDTVESVILSPATSPVVRERLIDVLAAAAFTFHGPGMEGFRSTWKRVRPQNKPESGIPFDMQDAMFEPAQGNRSRAFTSPPPQVTYVTTPHSPQVYPSWHQDSDHGHIGRRPGNGGRELPLPPRVDRVLIPPEEDMRRLFEECDVAVHSSRILNEALAYGTPESFRDNPVIQEYYAKCKGSHAMIIAQIPWASAGAARSRAKREETPNPELTKQEKLLAALLAANQELVDVFKCYDDLQAAVNAEQEKIGHNRGRMEQKADATQIQYISPEGVPITDPSQTKSYSGTSASSREPSPSRGTGRSHKLPPLPSAPPSAPPVAPPSAYATPTQPRFGHHHSHSSASVNSLMPPPPAPHGPRLAASHPRSRTPSPERQFALQPQALQSLPAVAVSAMNLATGVGFPTSSPPSSDPQYPIRHAPPLGPPPSHLNYPTTRQARIDSLRSISSVSIQGHGVSPSMRVDVGAANSYAAETDEEEIMTPVRPSEKALGKQRAPLDAEPNEEDLQTREEAELEEAVLRSQSPYVNGEEEMPENKIHYVYDAAEERAKQLAAEEAAELAALAAVKSRRSLDKQPTRTGSHQSSV